MISSTSNPKVKWAQALQRKRAERERQQLFVIEGTRLAEEAAQAGVNVAAIFHTPELDGRARGVLEKLARAGAPVETVTPGVLAAMAETQTPAGLLAVVALPNHPLPQPLTLALALDGLSDPGNVGTLLRTAVAAGTQAVFLGPGAVDIYNPKVVRSAMGAHFQVAVRAGDWETLTPAWPAGARWLAEARAGQPYFQVDWTVPGVLLVGGEAHGPGPRVRALATQSVHIPMPGRAESLNAAVAAGILLFEAARQRASGEFHGRK